MKSHYIYLVVNRDELDEALFDDIKCQIMYFCDMQTERESSQ